MSEEITTEEQTPPEQDNQESEQVEPQGPTEEQIAEAKLQGWAPKEEFRGDPDDWRDADEFLAVGEKSAGIMKERLDKANSDNIALKNQMDQMAADHEKRFERMSKMNKIALDKQKEQLEAHYEQKKLDAIEDMDMAAYHQIGNEQRKAMADFDEATKEPEPQQQTQPKAPSPEVQQWLAQNPWFNTDLVMTGAASALEGQLSAKNPMATQAQILSMVSKEIKKEFPHKFRPEGGGFDKVNGGSRTSGSSNNKKLSSRLQKEELAQAEADVKEGLYKNVEEWAAVYFEDDEGAKQ